MKLRNCVLSLVILCVSLIFISCTDPSSNPGSNHLIGGTEIANPPAPSQSLRPLVGEVGLENCGSTIVTLQAENGDVYQSSLDENCAFSLEVPVPATYSFELIFGDDSAPIPLVVGLDENAEYITDFYLEDSTDTVDFGVILISEDEYVATAEFTPSETMTANPEEIYLSRDDESGADTNETPADNEADEIELQDVVYDDTLPEDIMNPTDDYAEMTSPALGSDEEDVDAEDVVVEETLTETIMNPTDDYGEMTSQPLSSTKNDLNKISISKPSGKSVSLDVKSMTKPRF